MEQYATQMEAARKGIVTEELKKVAAKERMTTEELMPLVAEGKVVICANRHHKCIDPEGVGSMLRTTSVPQGCIRRRGVTCGPEPGSGTSLRSRS